MKIKNEELNIVSHMYVGAIICFSFGGILAAELKGAEAYPLWNGSESVAQYAARVNLPSTKTLQIGNNLQVELVLIPPGRFIMGTPNPKFEAEPLYRDIATGRNLFLVFGSGLLLLMSIVLIPSVRKRSRPKFSLGWLLLATVIAGGCVLSGLYWRKSSERFDAALQAYLASAVSVQAPGCEKPAHEVTLTRPYYMGKFVITQEQYQQVIGSNPSYFKGKDNPVDSVSWNDAQAFCKKLSAMSGQPIRLPTEAEWEYACRAGTTTTYYFGDNEASLSKAAWYNVDRHSFTGGASDGTTHPVGQKDPNPFGLFDMYGNVWEWCEDWYGEDYYAKSPNENPEGPAIGTETLGSAMHVRRGGSWIETSSSCRSAKRYYGEATDVARTIGFRVVVSTISTALP